MRPGEGYTGWRRRRRVGVEEATFVRRSHFCRGRGALFTLIRHGKRATFPKGEGKAKITFKIDDQTHKNMKNHKNDAYIVISITMYAPFMCVGHGTYLTGESPVAGIYRQA